MVPLFTYDLQSFGHKTVFGYIHISELKRVITLGCVWRQKFKLSHWHDSDISHTWKQRPVLCSGVTAHQQPSVWARAGKSMFCNHGVVNDSRLVLFSKSSFPHIIFFPLRQTGKCGQKRSCNGAAWSTESCRVFVLGGTLFNTGRLRLRTRQQSGNAGSNSKICLQRLNHVAKQTIVLVCRSMRKLKIMSDLILEQQHSDHRRIYQHVQGTESNVQFRSKTSNTSLLLGAEIRNPLKISQLQSSEIFVLWLCCSLFKVKPWYILWTAIILQQQLSSL